MAAPAGYSTFKSMRTFIIFLLSCAPVLGADGGLQVVSTARTNTQTASIATKDVFTRDGQTNLVRDTKTKAGVIQIRIHRFYHSGSLVGEFVGLPNSSGFTTEAGTLYSLSLELDASHAPKSLVIGTKDGALVDAFNCTNGIFSPVESSVLGKANAIGTAVGTAIDGLSKEQNRE